MTCESVQKCSETSFCVSCDIRRCHNKLIMVPTEALDAVEDGNLPALQKLDQSTLNERISDAFGCNCLHYAARQGGVDILQFLVQQRGFSGNVRSNVGATAAHDAAAAGNLEAVQWLYKNTSCNADDQDGTGATALHLACRFGHTHVVEWLLEVANVDTSKRTASGGIPLHFAVVGGDYDSVKLLLEDDPTSVNLQLGNGATATYLAAQEGHVEVLRLLIVEHRGNVKIKSYDGMSCLHAAAQSGHLDCVKFLIEEEKCNGNDRDFDGATPLHYAASSGHAAVIHWLMTQGGAKVTLDNLGGSPLHNAAENDQSECVKTLINNGCSINITDNNGLTAAELARKCFHDKCANLIETFTAQSQFPVDDDVAYLASVQSPRPFPNTLPVAPNGSQPSYNPGSLFQLISQGQRSPGKGYHGNSGIHGNTSVIQVNGNHTAAPGGSKVISEPVTKKGHPRIQARPRSPEVDYSINRSNRGPPGNKNIVPRLNFSDNQQEDTGPWQKPKPVSFNYNGRGSSSSSISSLSQLDEAIAIGEQELEKENRRGKELRDKAKFENLKITGASGQLYNRGSNSQSQLLGYENSDRQRVVNNTPDREGQRDGKTVTFNDMPDSHFDDSYIARYVSKMDVGGESTNASSGGTMNGGDTVVIVEQDVNGRPGSNRNSTEIILPRPLGDSPTEANGEHTNGSVNIYVNNPIPTAAQNVKQPAYSYTQNAPNVRNTPDSVKSGVVMVNGTCDFDDETSPQIHPPTVYGVTTPPSPTMHRYDTKIVNNDMTDEGSMRSTKNSTSNMSAPPPVATIPTYSAGVNQMQNVDQTTNGSIAPPVAQSQFKTGVSSKPQLLPEVIITQGAGNQINMTGSHPPVPPPPPPMVNGKPSDQNGNDTGTQPPAPPPPPPAVVVNVNKTTQNASAKMEEIKKKSASLPARPTTMFTPEMMQSQLSTLTPAKARVSIDASSNSDFISELKMATKGPGLRKTSNASPIGSKPAPTPMMSFSAGQKTNFTRQTSANDKDKNAKVELTGEWDPKHFVDQVPNRADLPAWKVQLQARQIAEKIMKETLETRKIEEKEARFKNMPAWKRAIVERKEAEAKAAEEKKCAEEQKTQHKVSNKRVPKVNVTTKTGEDGNLAPWQLELQRK